MPEYLRPGVYIEEVDTGAKAIEGVATSTTGFIGVAERGPTEPVLVTSFSEYARRFGRYLTDRYLARAVEGFFQNGGTRCFVARVVSRDPDPGSTRQRDDDRRHDDDYGSWAGRLGEQSPRLQDQRG